MAAVAVDLAADFAAGPGRAVNVDVGCAGTNGFDQLGDLARVDSLGPRSRGGRDVRAHVGGEDGA